MKELQFNSLIQEFIFTHYDDESRENAPEAKIENYFLICQCIYNNFYENKVYKNIEQLTKSRKKLFYEWCSGLPGILDTFDIFVYDNKKYYDESGYELDSSEIERLKTDAIYRELVRALEVNNFLQSNNLEIVKK